MSRKTTITIVHPKRSPVTRSSSRITEGNLPDVPGYRLHAHVASGGMGEVYVATSLKADYKVALKLVFPRDRGLTAAERIRQEVYALSGLGHCGIVEYVEHGITKDGIPFLATRWLEGLDLERRLAQGPLSVTQAITVVTRVAEVLAVAHEHDVIHCDIKPANIFLVDGCPSDPRLLDFGIALVKTQNPIPMAPGRIVGTPGYMSPEQVRGASRLDPRTDLFSLGCVLYECLSGEPAFSGEHVMAILAKVLMENPSDLDSLVPGLPNSLLNLVSRLLEKEPASRVDSARELVRYLNAIASDRTGSIIEPRGTITRDEQLLRSVLFFRDPAGARATSVDLSQIASEHFGYYVTLIDGTHLIVIEQGEVASDQATMAARCALTLHKRASHFAIAVVSGQGMALGQSIVGRILDRGAELLLRTAPGHIRVDGVTSSLLDASFGIEESDGGLCLIHGYDIQPGTRRLMGKMTPLVGRSHEMTSLETAFHKCVEGGRSAGIIVVGDAGLGKSRLRHELVTRLEKSFPAYTVLVGRGDPMRSRAPFSLMARVLYEVAGLEESEPAHIRRKKIQARVAHFVERGDAEQVTLYLGELVSAFPHDPPIELRLAREDSATMRHRIQAAWCAWLRAETNVCPVLFVLEDLHWADAASVQAMEMLLRECRGSPILVLALARPTVYERFPRLWEGQEVTFMELPLLSDGASRTLVREVLGSTIGPDEVERIVAGARGNAFFLEELIRAVANGSSEDFPDSVLGMMQVRLGKLPRSERQALRAASVFGRTAWFGGIRRLLGREFKTEELRQTLDHLVSSEWLRRHSRSRIPGEDEYGFRHALVCDAAYSTLTSSDRRVGHYLAGKWLKNAGEHDAVVLAEHYRNGEDFAEATRWFATAADHAFNRHEFDVVIQIYDRSMEYAVEGEARGRLLQRRAEIHAVLGQHQEAADVALAALKDLPQDNPRWCSTASEAAVAMGRAGQTVRMSRIIERLMALEPSDVGGAINFVGLGRAALPLAAAGEANAACRLLDKVIRITAAMGDENPEVLGHMHSARAMRAVAVGDFGTTYEELRPAAVAFERAGSFRNAIEHIAGAGFALLEMGCFDQAEKFLRQSIERSIALRLEHVCAVARHNLGRRVAETGRIEEGLELEQAALASFERHGHQRMMGLTRCHIAWIFLRDGRICDAAAEVALALSQLEAHPASRTIALATQARIHLASGAIDLGLRDARCAIESLNALDQVQEGESLIRLTWAEALAAVGRIDDARQAIVAARMNLDKRAGCIHNEQLRASFLQNVPENARIVRFAQEWLEPDWRPA